MADTPSSSEITGWLTQWREGDERARDQFFAVVHPQLRQIATRLLEQERREHTLEPNAVVSELCLRLIGNQPISYQDRAHFYAIAAQTMRRILIDHARARVAGKRGGPQRRVPLSDIEGWSAVVPSEDLLDLDTLLLALESADPRAARVVELRFFGGLREEDVAEVLQGVRHHGEAGLEGRARLARGTARLTRVRFGCWTPREWRHDGDGTERTVAVDSGRTGLFHPGSPS